MNFQEILGWGRPWDKKCSIRFGGDIDPGNFSLLLAHLKVEISDGCHRLSVQCPFVVRPMIIS